MIFAQFSQSAKVERRRSLVSKSWKKRIGGAATNKGVGSANFDIFIGFSVVKFDAFRCRVDGFDNHFSGNFNDVAFYRGASFLYKSQILWLDLIPMVSGFQSTQNNLFYLFFAEHGSLSSFPCNTISILQLPCL